MKVYLDLVGCRLNQSEIEFFARQFRAAGHELVANPNKADVAVINTCTVTRKAASDSRKKIRQMAREGVREIVVTGCWATLDAQEAASMPNVSRVVPNTEKEHLVPDWLRIPPQEINLATIARQPLPGPRSRTRSFIKVQDGCDNHCAYCVTTIARGPSRSRPISAILADIHAATQGGTKEVILTGAHIGSWGRDLSPPLHLGYLVKTILHESDIPRLRISSLEPWDLEIDFLSLWEEPRLCRQIHLPLQSGCETTLRRMARNTIPQAFAELVAAALSACPEIAITTDIIVGFPGESEDDFAESLGFVRRIEFAGGHVFTFSARPGTAAARMPDQVPYHQSIVRNAQMRSLLEQAARTYRSRFIGKTLPVLWETAVTGESGNWLLTGLTDNYIRVTATSPVNLWNQITPVHLLEMTRHGLYGTLANQVEFPCRVLSLTRSYSPGEQL
ncbi:MAG: MiaB/RimO family radical SAM methylthiotransferase [Chloroflexota bacterium]